MRLEKKYANEPKLEPLHVGALHGDPERQLVHVCVDLQSLLHIEAQREKHRVIRGGDGPVDHGLPDHVVEGDRSVCLKRRSNMELKERASRIDHAVSRLLIAYSDLPVRRRVGDPGIPHAVHG